MQVYFSHSYRDLAVNGYFIDRFARSRMTLLADKKSNIWCPAKLVRFVRETSGFISIVAGRPNPADPGAFSEFIGEELKFARRARTPRLLFVEEKVLTLHSLDFPQDAIPYQPDNLEAHSPRHDEAIRQFRLTLQTAPPAQRQFTRDTALVVAPLDTLLGKIADDASEMLRRRGFEVAQRYGQFEEQGVRDVRLLEDLWRAELCVFVLGENLSEIHLALALAYSHSIPSIRLQYDPRDPKDEPDISGAIRWRDRDKVLVALGRQIQSYREGLVDPIEIANEKGALGAAQSLSSVRWDPKDYNQWNKNDCPGLLSHVRPTQALVRDEADQLRKDFKREHEGVQGRVATLAMCRIAYQNLLRLHLAFEPEPISSPGFQAIRTPDEIEANRTANCLDLACLLAGIFEAALQAPIIVVIDGPEFAHALVGIRNRIEPAWRDATIGDLRREVDRGTVVFFEPTGIVQTDTPVMDETAGERREKILDFATAQLVAKRTIGRDDIRLRHIVDVEYLRRDPHPTS